MARQISRLRIEAGALIFEKVSGSPDLRIFTGRLRPLHA
jgi:hypothetical protein